MRSYKDFIMLDHPCRACGKPVSVPKVCTHQDAHVLKHGDRYALCAECVVRFLIRSLFAKHGMVAAKRADVFSKAHPGHEKRMAAYKARLDWDG